MREVFDFDVVEIVGEISRRNAHNIRRFWQVGSHEFLKKGVFYLLIGKIQDISAAPRFVILDGEVTGLIEKRHRVVPLGAVVVDALSGDGDPGSEIGNVEARVFELRDEETWSAGTEPVVSELSGFKGIYHTEGIIDTVGVRREAVAVVALAHFGQSLVRAYFLFVCQGIDFGAEVADKFRLGDAADGGIALVYADVGELVEVTEDADPRKLRNAGEENEAEPGVCAFEHAVETFQKEANFFVGAVVFQGLDEGPIVLVNEHDDLLPGHPGGAAYEAHEAAGEAGGLLRGGASPAFFEEVQERTEPGRQVSNAAAAAVVKVEVKDRVRRPFRFEGIDGEGLSPGGGVEEVAAALEIVLEGRDEQALSEPAGPAQKIGLAGGGQPVNPGGFVHIDKMIRADVFIVLYADGQVTWFHENKCSIRRRFWQGRAA